MNNVNFLPEKGARVVLRAQSILTTKFRKVNITLSKEFFLILNTCFECILSSILNACLLSPFWNKVGHKPKKWLNKKKKANRNIPTHPRAFCVDLMMMYVEVLCKQQCVPADATAVGGSYQLHPRLPVPCCSEAFATATTLHTAALPHLPLLAEG